MNKRVIRRQDLLQQVAGCVANHRCLKGLTLQGVSDASGVSVWALRYSFDDAPRLFRCVVAFYLGQIGRRIEYDMPPTKSVLAAIQDYAAFIAGVMREPEYRDFLYLVIRNCDLPWVRKAYQEKIVNKLGRGLEEVVAAAGEANGLPLALRPGAGARFVKRIESELVLPAFLPSTGVAEAPDVEKSVQRIARETFEATYVLTWDTASAA